MKEYTAYHVVTERPMTVGQVLCLDETYPSGVYRRVMEKVPLVEEIYQNPGAWAGKPLEHHTMVALRELALEQVRREQFPQHPSRLHCRTFRKPGRRPSSGRRFSPAWAAPHTTSSSFKCGAESLWATPICALTPR